MLITREMDYALRTLRALHTEERLPASVIAQRENMSKAITLKILKKFHAAGLVASSRGASGGYFLCIPCRELYLKDVFNALEDRLYLNRCQRPGYQCENRPQGDCGLCRELWRIQKVLEEELGKVPLSIIFQEK